MGSRDHKIKRELEEARKAGTLPPEKDAEGNLINPHIPEFMAKAPWYLRQDGPGLQHQRKSAEEKSAFGFTSYYRRGEFAGQATSYRKGACKNCGAMSHTDKDCTDRPRKVGAWKSGRDIKPDEFVPDGTLALDFDAKRDRYNGYDPAEHAATVARYEAAEIERKKLRAEAKAKAEAEAAAAKEARRLERAKRRTERFERRASRLERKAARKAAKAAATYAGAGAGAGAPSGSGAGVADAGASLAADAAARARGRKPPAAATNGGTDADADADDASTASRASGSTGGRSASPERRSSGAGAGHAAGKSGPSAAAAASSGSAASSSSGGSGLPEVKGQVKASASAAHTDGAVDGKGGVDVDADGDSDDDDDDSSDTASSVLSSSSGFGSSDDDDDAVGAGDSDDDVRERDNTEILGSSKTTKGSAKAKMGVRNLRLREDRAKYLINLDVDSAYYDPKTRSMREDPFAGMAGHISTSGLGGPVSGADSAAGAAGAAGTYRGDLAWRRSGDYQDMMQAQMFAWEAAEQGAEVHLQANPTQLELMRKQVASRKTALEEEKKSAVLERYGGAEHLAPVPKELLMGQGEGYVEYGRDGRAINVTAPMLPSSASASAGGGSGGSGAGASSDGSGHGLGSGASALVARSRYEEDVWPGNHTSVWGSWWDKETRSWGYACCNSTAYSDYCTGRAGREAQRASKDFAERAAAAAASGSLSASAAAAASAASAAAAASSAAALTGSKRRLESSSSSGRGGGGSSGADDMYSIGEAGYGGAGAGAGGSVGSGFGERSFKRARGGGGGGDDD